MLILPHTPKVPLYSSFLAGPLFGFMQTPCLQEDQFTCQVFRNTRWQPDFLGVLVSKSIQVAESGPCSCSVHVTDGLPHKASTVLPLLLRIPSHHRFTRNEINCILSSDPVSLHYIPQNTDLCQSTQERDLS